MRVSPLHRQQLIRGQRAKRGSAFACKGNLCHIYSGHYIYQYKNIALLRGASYGNPAAGESTAEVALTISIDSATTEEDKKPKPSASSSKQRSSSAPKTISQTRSSSTGAKTRTSERDPSKTVMQCLQTNKKGKDREPRSPEQLKSRSSSRRRRGKLRSHLLRWLDDKRPNPPLCHWQGMWTCLHQASWAPLT